MTAIALHNLQTPAATLVMSQATPPKKTAVIPQTLEDWVAELSKVQMPVFAHTARIVGGEQTDNELTAQALSKEILQDPSMTTRILKLANSILHNPVKSSISTVSRAIVVLGFKNVRNLCMSIAILDSVLANEPREKVQEEIARCYHAAVQAQDIAEVRGDKCTEEVFIATLLFQLGRLVFWCFADRFVPGLSTQYQTLLANPAISAEQAERDLLGFSLHELTTSLNQEWHLSPLLNEALGGNQQDDPRIGNLALGYEVADTLSRGWDHADTKDLIKRLSESLYLPAAKVQQRLQENARGAARAMHTLGAVKASRLIPLPSKDLPTVRPKDPRNQVNTARGQFLEPDSELQLRVLRELTQMSEEKPNINLIMEVVLEGMFRGMGMDRALFALVSPDRKLLRAKHALGWERDEITQRFRFPINSPQNVFDVCMTQRDALWFRAEADTEYTNLITPAIKHMCHGQAFMCAPIQVGSQVIGVFYIDRAISRRVLDSEAFASFRLFWQQACLALRGFSK